MGVVGIFSSSSHDRRPGDRGDNKWRNPDPRNFRLLRLASYGRYLVAEVLYPDCTNYEGRKILLYDSMTLDDLRMAQTCDPHFSHEAPELSPIARFVPTAEGWRMALRLARLLGTPGD